MIRLGENAVYRLASPVVARIGRTAAYIDDAQKEAAVARWPAIEGFPFDVMRWPGYRVLGDVRELLMVTWFSQKAGQDGFHQGLHSRNPASETSAAAPGTSSRSSSAGTMPSSQTPTSRAVRAGAVSATAGHPKSVAIAASSATTDMRIIT
jgi:hypothetical protein